MKKKIICLLLAAMLCVGCTITAVAETDSTVTTGAEEVLVYDDADLLTDSEELALNKKLAEVSAAYNAQVVVGTVDAMEDDVDIDTFIEFAYDELEMGYGENHDGVFLLVCMDPREYRILSNGLAGDAITLDTIDTISDAIVSDLSAGNYADAFNQFAVECDYYLNGYINGFPFDYGMNLVISLGIGLVVALIITGGMKGQLKSVKKQPAATEYTKPGSLQVVTANEFYLYRVVTSRPKEKSSSGSSSGGSSRNVGGGSF